MKRANEAGEAGESNEARPAARVLLAMFAGVAAMMLSAPVRAEDRAAIDKTQIVGSKELPKVLYIVPWKKPPPGELSTRPLESVLDEALAPVDRDVFRRQVRYNAQVQPGATAAVPAPAAK